jgi:hypothetical protein
VIASPPHLVTTVPGLVHAVRLEGATIGWTHGSCYAITVLLAGRFVRLGEASATGCTNETPPFFAVGSSGDAIWVAKEFGNIAYQYVNTPTYYEEIDADAGDPYGDNVTGVAATGSTVVFSVLRVDASLGCTDSGLSGPCIANVSPNSYVARVVGRKRIKLAGIPPPLAITGREGRLAVVVAATDLVGEHVVQSGDVDVLTLPGGRKLGGVHVDGPIDAVAVSRDVLAVRSGATLYRFGVQGRLFGETAIPTGVSSLSASGTRIVFAAGRVIRLLDARTGHARIIAVAQAPPLGVSISGNRIVWAERGPHQSRILELRLR